MNAPSELLLKNVPEYSIPTYKCQALKYISFTFLTASVPTYKLHLQKARLNQGLGLLLL